MLQGERGLAFFEWRHPSGAIPAARPFCWLQLLLPAGRIGSPHPYPL